MANRAIFFSAQCDACADRLGGYERIDQALDAVWDALHRNPYALPKIESDWYAARYLTTKPFRDVPALLWTIEIQSNGDVVIDHVEIYDDY